MEGLRERKKRQTRELIAATAMELFQARGFEDVTVAEVARAADVSEKTVFNYFPTKEDLVFSRGEEHLAERAQAIRERVPAVPLVTLFEAETMSFLDGLEHGPIEDVVAIPRLVRSSPALRNGLVMAWEREAAVLVEAVTGGDDDDLVADVVVRALVWTQRLVFRTAIRRLVTGEEPAAVAAELRIEARRAYAQLERGLAGYQG